MNEILWNLLAVAAGGVLGLLFFGGLWWTLQRALASPRPALWFGASALLRIATATAGFVVISAGLWQRMLLSLIGFWVARWLVQRLIAAPAGASRPRSDAGKRHATRPPSPTPQKWTPQ